MKKKIAIPVSSVGYHWEEVVAAYLKFKAHQIEVDFFTPEGRPAVVDPTTVIKTGPFSLVGFGTPRGIAPDTQVGQKFSAELAKARSFTDLKTADYAAIFIPGGHGCLQDVNRHSVLHGKILELYRDKKVLGGVCHGTSTFALVKDQNGVPITRGRQLTGFPDFLDKNLARLGLVHKEYLPLPISNDALLEESGARLGFTEKLLAVLWPLYMRLDPPFVTGMGPKSAAGVADEMLRLLHLQ